MSMIARPALAVLVMLGLVPSAVATDEVTLAGTIACAKCTLKKPDAKECQNVLLVATEDGKQAQYYIADGEASEKFGEVCTETPKMKVTGTLSEKEGRKWITPSRMERVKG